MPTETKDPVIQSHKTLWKTFRFKARLYLHYYFSALRYVILVSIGISIILLMSEIIRATLQEQGELQGLLDFFLNMLPTYGTVGGIFLYHRFRRYEYFFYYNRGIKISSLIIFTFTVNILLYLVVQLLLQWVPGWNGNG